MSDPPCSTCGHPITMSRCWRLTCPTNGAKESFNLALPGVGYVTIRRLDQSGIAALRHPQNWGEPPEQGFML